MCETLGLIHYHHHYHSKIKGKEKILEDFTEKVIIKWIVNRNSKDFKQAFQEQELRDQDITWCTCFECVRFRFSPNLQHCMTP